MVKDCKCNFCIIYDRYKWAVIKECKCGCHKSDGMSAHDIMCCSIPNGLIKNNPYPKLAPLKYYQRWLDRFEKEADE